MGNGLYEVLSPWGDRDPLPLKGLATRLSNLAGKKIGLFRNDKRGAKPTLDAVERKLKAKYPTAEFVPFFRSGNISVIDTDKKEAFKEWIKKIDGAIYGYGD